MMMVKMVMTLVVIINGGDEDGYDNGGGVDVPK